ncbi:hypothetical protein [Candidatus Nitrospira bockiana]
MATPDYEALRTAAEQAYKDLITGKIRSYTINGRTVTYHDPSALLDEITKLNALIAGQTGARNFAGFSRRPS